jgi:hydroxyethylthiazole kinase-like uncharacterized protein yjeF
MKSILLPEQQTSLDSVAMQDYAMPALLLMENAARSAAEKILQLAETHSHAQQLRSVLILCGSGNNGGDGFAIARHLHHYAHVRIAWIGDKEKMSPETLTNMKISERLGIPMAHIVNELDVKTLNTDADIIIDALIGVGGNENLRGIVTFLLDKVSGMWDSFGNMPSRQHQALHIAIDIPTGLNGATGLAHPSAFQADYTITMLAPKLGMYINQGTALCGTIDTVSIGAPTSLPSTIARYHCHEPSDIADFFPPRRKNTSKFDYGRVMIIGGSTAMSGAVCLSAHAAFAAGAGLVELYTPSVHAQLMPEVIAHTLMTTEEGTIHPDEQHTLLEAMNKADAIIMGPGLGKNTETLAMIRSLILAILHHKPLILDADALCALHHTDILSSMTILTPHLGEYARLTGQKREDIADTFVTQAQQTAHAMQCTLLLKNTPTIITDGKNTILNINGNPGMATAGSGDVLAGIIGSVAAQKIAPLYAASLGAYIHAMAGDSAATIKGQISLTASDIIKALPSVLTFQ